MPLGIASGGRQQLVVGTIPQRVYLCIEVYFRGVDGRNWRFKLQLQSLFGIYFIGVLHANSQRWSWHLRLIILSFLFQLLLLLLPFLIGSLELFHSSLVRLFRQHLKGVGLTDELARRIGHEISHFHAQRVLIDQGCVAQPIVDGVAFGVRNGDKGIMCVEIQAFYLRQFGITITEIHGKMVGFIARNT